MSQNKDNQIIISCSAQGLTIKNKISYFFSSLCSVAAKKEQSSLSNILISYYYFWRKEGLYMNHVDYKIIIAKHPWK